jgi:kinesin family protein C2/C3
VQICQATYKIYENSSIMRRRYLSEMKQRKKLHNQLVELKGNIRVLCRVRPVIDEDGSGGYIHCTT